MTPESLQSVRGGGAELARVLCELCPAGVAWFDATGALREHNAEFERIVGALPATAAECRLRPITPAAAAGTSAPAAPIARALAGKAVHGEEHEVARSDGTTRWVRLSAVPLADGAGALLVLVDVAERRGLDPMRQQVLGVVAHDLRNPLSALRMTTAMLVKPREMPVERRVQLGERMLGTIGRMEGLVASLVELARAEAGVGVRLARERVDLGALFDRVRKDLEVVFPGRALVERRQGALGGVWDVNRIERVLGHLLANAFRYGREEAPVTVVLDGAAASAVSVSVHNEGPPIPPELLPSVFEPFTIGPVGPEGRRRSLGLGLYIVRSVVAAHGGGVSVRSTANEGTTFTLTLPREAEGAPGGGR